MIDLSARSYKKELLDDSGIPFADIRQNMKELNTVNKYLGGHKITISGIKKIITGQTPGRPVTICEIGCGGGDNLKAIEAYCSKKISRPLSPALTLNRNALLLQRSNTQT